MHRAFFILLGIVFLSGCQHLASFQQNKPQVTSIEPTCVFIVGQTEPPELPVSAQQCQQSYWLAMWQTAIDQTWRERRAVIDSLSRTDPEKLQAFILSQPLDTPYQYRLRAQSQFDSLVDQLSPSFEQLLRDLAYTPSQKLLEYESAVTVLSQVNTRQKKLIDEQAQILQEQQEKLDQLLKIESTILENATEQ